jgi:hypothetical protein
MNLDRGRSTDESRHGAAEEADVELRRRGMEPGDERRYESGAVVGLPLSPIEKKVYYTEALTITVGQGIYL